MAGHSIGKQSSPNPGTAEPLSAPRRLLHEVAGEHQVGVGHAHAPGRRRCGRVRGAPARPSGPRGRPRGPRRTSRSAARSGSRRSRRACGSESSAARLPLQRGPAAGQGLGGRFVGDHRQAVVRLGEDGVAEGVVEVLVGVDDRDHVAGAEPAHELEGATALGLGGAGVDDQQAPVAGDHADVDVEGLEAAPPSSGRRSRRSRCRVRCQACAATLVRLALGTGECQAVTDERDEEAGPWSRTASSPSSARSWRTTCPPRSRWAPSRWSTGTGSASRRPRCATTWPRWRRRASSPSRTPAPAGSRPTRATGCSSTG